MTTREALTLIQTEAEKARIAIKTATPSKRQALTRRYYDWQSCLEVATEIHNLDAPDALERIMALKLAVKLQ